MKDKYTMRDAFFNRLYNLAKEDRDIILVSADMGAPALDKFRKDLNDQFINTGIAEQNTIAIATGLALSGKKVYAYAIAPFITSRCHEFIKVDACLMDIPINVIGVGAGYGYDDSGPTHHTTEDISIMRPLPNLELYSPSDARMANEFAKLTYESNKVTYVRLDRQLQNTKYDDSESFDAGFSELREGYNTCMVATGNMVDKALEISDLYAQKDVSLGVIDLYMLKPLNPQLKEVISKYDKIVSLEEHLLVGGMGSILSEIITDNDLSVKLRRAGVDDKYVYEYGGRTNIQEQVGLGTNNIIDKIEN